MERSAGLSFENVPFTQAIKAVSRWGLGSKDLVAAMEAVHDGLPENTFAQVLAERASRQIVNQRGAKRDGEKDKINVNQNS